MKVVVENDSVLDLSASALNDEAPVVTGKVTVTGCGVFDEQERLLPLVSEYLSRAAQTSALSRESQETYGRNLGYLVNGLGRLPLFEGSTPDEILLTVTRPTLAAYIADLRRLDGIDPVTIRNRDACFRSFFNKFLCVADEDQPARRKDNPYALGFISPSPNRKLVHACSPEDLSGLIQSTDSERERCLLQFIFDAGLRRSEVGRVSLQSIKDALRFSQTQMVYQAEAASKPSYCPLFVYGSKGHGDEYKARYAIVSRATLERIAKYQATPLYKRHASRFESPETTPAFFNADGAAYNADSVSGVLRRISERGVKLGLLQKPVAPHKLRHGHAYAILRSPDMGNDVLERMLAVQRSLGHAHMDTTDIYTQITLEAYRYLCTDESGLMTRAEMMAQLWTRTSVRIDLRAKK